MILPNQSDGSEARSTSRSRASISSNRSYVLFLAASICVAVGTSIGPTLPSTRHQQVPLEHGAFRPDQAHDIIARIELDDRTLFPRWPYPAVHQPPVDQPDLQRRTCGDGTFIYPFNVH